MREETVMTKNEIQIVKEAVKEHQKVMLHYYEEGKKTGNWEDHKIACESLRSVRELARNLGISE
jgi:hypothetical protein